MDSNLRRRNSRVADAPIGAPFGLVGGGVYVVPLGDAVFANGFD